jgi:hypothetical protein
VVVYPTLVDLFCNVLDLGKRFQQASSVHVLFTRDTNDTQTIRRISTSTTA